MDLLTLYTDLQMFTNNALRDLKQGKQPSKLLVASIENTLNDIKTLTK